MNRFLLAAGLLLSVVSCSDDPKPLATGGPCGAVVCTANQVCDATSSAPLCKCVPGYAGANCTSCAAGFLMSPQGGGCVATPVDCSRGTSACTGHGTCVPQGGAGLDSCQCTAGYTGNACQTCADGYQDNDNNRTCLPTCTNPATVLTCTAPRTCNDTAGTAICSCAPGATGTNCDMCLSGYTRQANGACLKCPGNTGGEGCMGCASGFLKQPDGSCAPCPMFSTGLQCEMCLTGYAKDPATGACVKSCTSNSQCGTQGFCDMAQPVPACTCKPGFAGANCADCATGYTRDALQQCVLLTIPAGTGLLGVGLAGGVSSILAINTMSGVALPLRSLPSGITQLASDVDNKVLYGLDSQGVKKVDLASGALTPVTTLASSTNLAFAAGNLYAVPTVSPYLLKRINPTTGGVADLGPTQLVGIQALAFDAVGGSFVAATWINSRPELHRVSATDGTPTALGPVTFDGMALPPSNAKVGIAFDGTSGAMYATTAVGRNPSTLFTQHCRQIAAGVGLAGYEQAPFTTMEYPTEGVAAGVTKVLGSAAASGKEIIAFAGNATAAMATPGIIRIESVNPDAFVCLMANYDNVKLVIASTAKFAGIAITGNRPRLSMEIEGVREVVTPQVHIALTSETYLDASVRAYALNKVYTRSEWSTKKLPTVTSLWGTDTTAPLRLVQVDPLSYKALKILAFDGIELSNQLTAWKP